VKQLGTGEGIVYRGTAPISQEDDVRDYLRRYGASAFTL